MNLYQVRLGSGGMKDCYVVADDPTSAYNTTKEFMDINNYCYTDDRELYSVTLIAKEKGTFNSVYGKPYLFMGVNVVAWRRVE